MGQSALRALPVVCLAVFLGCEAPPGQPAHGGTTQHANYRPPSVEQVLAMRDPNVVGVAALYDSMNPWLWTENRARVRGVYIKVLYLSGPHSRGVFGDGIIRPKMYVLETDEQGDGDWELAREWEFDVEAALPFRAKREVMLGWGYGLIPLPWGDMDMAGREIRVIVEFERLDGHIVSSGKKDFRVPPSRRP
jgi:hypothetical protein